MPKYLVMCQRGNVRSVAAAFILKDLRGHNDVVTCGMQTTSMDTKFILGGWADKILVCGEPELIRWLPVALHVKVVNLDVGNDIWGNPKHPDLQAKMDEKLHEVGL